jgi:hypothetical protein
MRLSLPALEGLQLPWLPTEVWVHIFGFLADGRDLGRLALVCSAWRTISESDALWRRFVGVSASWPDVAAWLLASQLRQRGRRGAATRDRGSTLKRLWAELAPREAHWHDGLCGVTVTAMPKGRPVECLVIDEPHGRLILGFVFESELTFRTNVRHGHTRHTRLIGRISPPHTHIQDQGRTARGRGTAGRQQDGAAPTERTGRQCRQAAKAASSSDPTYALGPQRPSACAAAVARRCALGVGHSARGTRAGRRDVRAMAARRSRVQDGVCASRRCRLVRQHPSHRPDTRWLCQGTHPFVRAPRT